MTEPSPIFLLAMTTFALAIFLGGLQLERVWGKKPRKLKKLAETTTPGNNPEYQSGS